MRYLFAALIFLSGCSTLTICCPNHAGEVTASSFDLFGGTTTISCGGNVATAGGNGALLSALLPLLAAAGKVPVGATATPQTYQCQ